MKATLVRLSLLVILCAALVSGVGRAEAPDFGDHTSATLTGKAWKSLGAERFDEALTYTAKCRELYMAEAVKQQGSLTDFAAAEKAHDYWALNDVGTCLFIEGQVREKQGDKPKAAAVYGELVSKLKYCQCWDTNGWFWRPAEAAADKAKQLDFDAKLD
jgi:hypothetical protein